MNEPTVRVVSPRGAYVGRVSVAEAKRRIRCGIARPVGVTRRCFGGIQMVYAQVGEYPSGTKYTYDEDLGDGMHLEMLKRIALGVPYRWDENLSFDELRAGKAISEVTLAKRREERSLRRAS